MQEFRINFKNYYFLENCYSSSQVLRTKGGAKKGNDGFPGDSCPQKDGCLKIYYTGVIWKSTCSLPGYSLHFF